MPRDLQPIPLPLVAQVNYGVAQKQLRGVQHSVVCVAGWTLP